MSNARTFFEAELDSQLQLPGVATEDDLADEWTWSEEEEFLVDRFNHATVMCDEVVSGLGVCDGGVYVDVTLGGGGHSEAILSAAQGARVIAFDRDQVALGAAKLRLAPFGDRVTFVHASFSELRDQLTSLGVSTVSGLCADLGVSSPQLDEAERGMSFRREGPIDMRMDTSRGQTALELIANSGDDELANIIFRFGDERRSRRIARSIKRACSADELHTTLDLRRAIVRATGPVRHGGVDPATRTFQAIRIAVNDELGELITLLAALPQVLAPGSIAAVISFHSLEDREVKRTFHQKELWAPLTKKPQIASENEQTANARSRSAKLRVARFSPLTEGDDL